MGEGSGAISTAPAMTRMLPNIEFVKKICIVFSFN